MSHVVTCPASIVSFLCKLLVLYYEVFLHSNLCHKRLCGCRVSSTETRRRQHVLGALRERLPLRRHAPGRHRDVGRPRPASVARDVRHAVEELSHPQVPQSLVPRPLGGSDVLLLYPGLWEVATYCCCTPASGR